MLTTSNGGSSITSVAAPQGHQANMYPDTEIKPVTNNPTFRSNSGSPFFIVIFKGTVIVVCVV